MKIVTTVDTFFKLGPEDSSTLGDDRKAFVGARREFPVLAYRLEQSHVVFTLDPAQNDLAKLHPSRRNTWWVWMGAIEDPEGFGPSNNPVDAPAQPARGQGVPFKLPGYTQQFFSGDPLPGCSHFIWAEALHFSGATYRRPENAAVVNRLIATGRALEEVRVVLGNRPIRITSWYRDPATNRRVGGASQSRHMAGDGVDIWVPGMSPNEVFRRLDDWWGARGGLAWDSGFTHLDLRGARARWRYRG